jgi:hypothetical protein
VHASSASKTGALPSFHYGTRASYRVGGIRWDDLTEHQPIKENPERGQVLLEGQRRAG